MKTRTAVLTVSVLIIWIAAMMATQGRVGAAPSTAPINVLQQTNACHAILQRAMDALQHTCDQMGRNSACYGNDTVKAELNGVLPLKFDTLGDKVPIQVIRQLATSPLDINKGTWGLSLLKLQANLPDTMPGQNVMFLVYGDTTVQNISGDMQAFYFTTGLGGVTCKEVPHSGIVVRSPNHAQVTFTANGVKVTIASTITLQAVPNQSLDLQLLEGKAEVATAQGAQTLQPGQMVSVPLGGSSGLEAVGQPSAPVAAPVDPALNDLLDQSKGLTPDSAPGVIGAANNIPPISISSNGNGSGGNGSSTIGNGTGNSKNTNPGDDKKDKKDDKDKKDKKDKKDNNGDGDGNGNGNGNGNSNSNGNSGGGSGGNGNGSGGNGNNDKDKDGKKNKK